MSLYNTIYGVNPATFFILPMLGKHPDEYPRFRDCFVGAMERGKTKDIFGMPVIKSTKEKVISVYTRVGGSNRSEYSSEIGELRSMPNYLRDYDDDFDSTFATFVFSVPEQWQEDFESLQNGTSVSKEYLEEMKRVFPKLVDKLDETFKK
jgi:hypothetical protein